MTDIFDQDRGEDYEFSDRTSPVLLPITKKGFESLVKVAASIFNLPVDDNTRSQTAGYIHHIERDCPFITINKLADVLYKLAANRTSWRVDQEAKERERKEATKTESTGTTDEKESLPN